MDGPTFTAGNEGFIPVAKPDAQGKWVYGIGRDIPAPSDPSNPPTCTPDEAETWFAGTDYPNAVSWAARDVGPQWDGLSDVRKAALSDMAFEMGESGLAEFRSMLLNVRMGYWVSAMTAALQSRWATQVSTRSDKVAHMIGSGAWPAA